MVSAGPFLPVGVSVLPSVHTLLPGFLFISSDNNRLYLKFFFLTLKRLDGRNDRNKVGLKNLHMNCSYCDRIQGSCA